MWLSFRVLVGVGTGLGTGIGVLKQRGQSAESEHRARPPASEIIPPPELLERLHSCPYLVWDHNWDRRSVVKKDRNGEFIIDEKKNLLNIRRHVVLVNDCHYVNEVGCGAQSLTAIGETQAADLAHFLADWMTWEEWVAGASIVHSPMTRSRELAKFITKEMGSVPVTELDLLEEGIPAPRSPRPMGIPILPNIDLHEDHPRLEAAFRALFHRPDPTQKVDDVQIVLAHPNVIRYFICRSLQLPPEAYIRFSLNHASLTRIEILGDGRVQVVSVGDTGYLTPAKFTIGEMDTVPPMI